jgi:hypothetical protein
MDKEVERDIESSDDFQKVFYGKLSRISSGGSEKH